jgi:aminomethyltransferase
MLKNTPFYHFHQQLAAKMLPFAGYNMPISYTSINEEHLLVRQKVGVFDVSHMGQFIVRGEGAFELVQKLSSNDVAQLYEGKVQYSCLLYPNGTIVDDMLVYCLPNGVYMLVVNAANIQKDWDYIVQHAAPETTLIDISDRTALLAVQGPLATEVLHTLTAMGLKNMDYYTCEKGVFAGVSNVLVSATGYTGAGGFEIYFDQEHADTIWNAIFEAGKSCGIAPIGLAARNTLRLEKGYMLYGNDIDDTTSPLEAGLGWICKLNKGDFVGRDALQAQKQAGLTRRLVGFELLDKGVARDGCLVQDANGMVIGKVTSAAPSPSLKKSIGMAYVAMPFAKPETSINIVVRDKALAAKVVAMPFLPNALK